MCVCVCVCVCVCAAVVGSRDRGMLTTVTCLSGHVALWDLEERKLLGQMWEAHQGAVTGMVALPSEPLLVTSSPDNTLKVSGVERSPLTDTAGDPRLSVHWLLESAVSRWQCFFLPFLAVTFSRISSV